jgi:hypothetical protein
MQELFEVLHRRVSRRNLLRGAAVLAASPLLLRTAKADSAPPAGPRWLAFGNDPKSEVTVSSYIAGQFRSASLDYGLDHAFGSSVPLNVRGVAGVQTRYASAQLSRLSPGTRYLYRIRIDETTSKVSAFTTAPTAPGSFSFTAFGDAGTTPHTKLILAQIAKHKPQIHLVAGDLCYAYTAGTGLSTGKLNLRQWDHWLRIINPVSNMTPWMTTVGNHEMEPGFGPQGYTGYLARFSTPKNGPVACPAAYHYQYGSVAFVHVDSNDVSYEIPHNLGYSHGTQDAWLNSTLESYRSAADVDFIVVVMHHCAYSTATAHGCEGGVREHWARLFDRYNVDLVISGHNHSYERSHPVRAGQPSQHAPKGATLDSSLGTTYLTVGGGGEGLNSGGFYHGTTRVHTAETSTGKHSVTAKAPWSAVTDTSYCYVHCAVTPRLTSVPPSLTLTVFDQSDKKLDAVTLTRSSIHHHDNSAIYAAAGAGAALTVGGGAYAVSRRRFNRPAETEK